jgi:hypothetical protein
MATYKFPQFTTEIVDPTITVTTVTDSIQIKKCNVDVLMVTSTANFGITLTGFTYTDDWNDSEVEVWTMVELSKYIV